MHYHNGQRGPRPARLHFSEQSYQRHYRQLSRQNVSCSYRTRILWEAENDDDSVEDSDEDSKYLNKKDIEVFKSLKFKVDKNDEFQNYFTKKEFHYLQDLFLKNHKKKNKLNKNGIEELLKNKIKKNIDEFFCIDKYISIQVKVISELKIDPLKNNKLVIKKRLEEMMKSSKGIANPKQSILYFEKFINKIYSFDENNATIQGILKDYILISNYLNNTSAMRFLLVGPHNSGKSSLLNTIIGYNQNFLPTKTEECTKIGVIIKYAKKGEEAKMYETFFRTNENNLNYFEYNNDNLVAEGERAIYEKIDELNNNKYAKSDLKFYLLKAPIEFLDQMNLNEEEKEKIELIDFPGLDTNFEQAQIKAENLLNIIDGFIYINFQINFDDGDQKILTLIYNTIKQRNNFSFDTCLFILNKIDKFEQEIDLNAVSNKILDIFDKENSDLPSTKVLEQKERINVKSLSVTPFSCLKYKEYKLFEINLLDFEKFIEIND